MSAYTTAVLAEMAPGKPTFFYQMNESSGQYLDTGPTAGAATHLTAIANAGITRNSLSIVPGDSGASVLNTAETQVAERTHNVLLDQPNSPGTGFTLLAWARPDRVESGGNQVIISKANVYQLLFEGTQIRFDSGTNIIRTGNDMVTPGNVMFIACVYNAAAGALQHKIYLNAVERASGTAVSNPPWTTGSSKLEVGGFSTFGTTGFYGGIQHLVIGYDTYLSVAAIQRIYQAGAASAAEVAGLAANVFPWSRQVIGGNALRKRLRFTNTSDGTIFLSLGVPAVAGGGIALRPGDFWESPKGGAGVYTGTVHGIHRARSGAKQLAIEEE